MSGRTVTVSSTEIVKRWCGRWHCACACARDRKRTAQNTRCPQGVKTANYRSCLTLSVYGLWVELQIKEIKEDEIEICAQMMATTDPWSYLQWSHAECETSLREEGLRLHGAYDEGELVGFLASLDHGIGFEPLIEYLCVAAHARDHGIGSALIHFFETKLHASARNLYLFVSDINDNAQRLYLRRGYLPVGALPNFNLTGQTEFLFRRTRGPLR